MTKAIRLSLTEFILSAGMKEIIDMSVPSVAAIDDKGRCCGRKPIVYKRDGILFCPRRDRAYDLVECHQVANWAYKKNSEGWFVR